MDTNVDITTLEGSIARYFGGPREKLIVNNVSYGLLNHECDVLICTKSGCLTEVEIKRSFSDLKADFKKEHHHDNDRRIKSFYYCLPESIVEKSLKLFQEKVDSGIIKVMPAILSYDENCVLSYVKESGSPDLHLDGERPLNEKEMAKLGHLGCMRAYNLQESMQRMKSDYASASNGYWIFLELKKKVEKKKKELIAIGKEIDDMSRQVLHKMRSSLDPTIQSALQEELQYLEMKEVKNNAWLDCLEFVLEEK